MSKSRSRRDFERANIGALLRDSHTALEDHLHRRMAEAGYPDLRPSHGKVFQFVGDGARVQDLAFRARVTKQAMAQVVDYLEVRGYVERRPHPEDARASLVRLTDKGRKTLPVALLAIREVEAWWAEILGAPGFDRLRELLLELEDGMRIHGPPS